MEYKFAEWLLTGCPVGIMRSRPSTDYHGHVQELLATLRHDNFFELMSSLRASPIAHTAVHRGLIPPDDPTIFRVATTLKVSATPEDWHATDKHRAAFIIPTEFLRDLDHNRHSTTRNIWAHGILLFVRSAPLSKAGKWRITLAPSSPITGDVIVLMLQWLGNVFFAHECLRRASMVGFGNALKSVAFNDPTTGLLRECPPRANLFKAVLSEEVINDYVTLSNVPLDQEQLNILEQINQSDKPLICIRALAGAGKTAVAHCLLHAFLSSTAKDTPRKLAFFTVPTRELREEVVLELIRSKAPMHVATVPSLHQTC
jgi:hypothetical protein